MPLKYGDRVVIVANPYRKTNAAFKRWEKGVKEVYVIRWTSFHGDRFNMVRLREDGRTDRHWYDVASTEILPERIVNKKLEDYT